MEDAKDERVTILGSTVRIDEDLGSGCTPPTFGGFDSYLKTATVRGSSPPDRIIEWRLDAASIKSMSWINRRLAMVGVISHVCARRLLTEDWQATGSRVTVTSIRVNRGWLDKRLGSLGYMRVSLYVEILSTLPTEVPRPTRLPEITLPPMPMPDGEVEALDDPLASGEARAHHESMRRGLEVNRALVRAAEGLGFSCLDLEGAD